jgi:PAS domain S-box-containing protein
MFCAVAGTISLVLIYIYLYVMYRERYMGILIVNWICFSLRIILFDYGTFAWKTCTIATILYYVLYIGTVTMFLWSNSLFINAPINRWWLYCGSGSFLLGTIFKVLSLPIYFSMIPLALFSGTVLIYIGQSFAQKLPIKWFGNYITGYSFILWGLFTIFMPYSTYLTISWPYLVCGILRLIIASGIIMVYFEKTKADLIKKETQYRLLAENAADIIFRYKLLPKAKFEYVSPAALAITGYPPDEFYANHKIVGTLVHPNDMPTFRNFLNNPWRCTSFPFTMRLIRKNNIIIWIEQKVVPIYDTAGNLVAMEGIVRDVTERKHLEQIAARANKIHIAGKMAIDFADEIRNPLTTIFGYLQILAKKKDFFKYRSAFTLMLNELERTNSVISQYLLLANDKRAERSPCNLNDIIQSLYPLLETKANGSHVEIILNLKTLPLLSLDATEIRYLLIHLVNNAIEAMPTGGTLMICTIANKHTVTLSVRDHGPGIPAHVLEDIGTPFITTKETASGLGLTMCYLIANRHNAIIDIQTNTYGTNILVHFPPISAA